MKEIAGVILLIGFLCLGSLMSEWIKCSDQLPKSEDKVIFVYADNLIRDDLFFHNRWMKQSPMDYWGPFKGKVTHWMPFPMEPRGQ